MSIDMKEFSGEIAPAAGGNVESNTYQQEVHDESYAMPEISKEAAPTPVEPPSPQEDPQDRNFKALASEVDKIKAERDSDRREYQLNLEMMRNNLAQKAEPAQPERKMFHDMQDSDIPNVAEIRREWDERESAYQLKIEELQVAQNYPDYKEVVEKFFGPLLKEKPILAQGIQGAKNKSLLVYELCKMAQAEKAQAPSTQPAPLTPPSKIAERIVENARKPGSVSSAGGTGTLSKADYYANMSDAEFMKFAAKNLEAI